MRVCPKCGYREPPIWLNHQFQQQDEYYYYKLDGLRIMGVRGTCQNNDE